MSIPRIIHQMWRDEHLPPRWAACCETWKRHHPGWEYRFWTDASLREFVAKRYPDFLEVYDGYARPVMRSDAARYLLLDHFGGMYADLDMECLRSVEALVAGQGLLLPLEPEAHLESRVSVEHGVRRLVGNAWMASEPGHAFWERVKDGMRQRRALTAPLMATGPFLLSDLVNQCTSREEMPTLLPSETVYPVTNLDVDWLASRVPGSGHGFGPGTNAIHYWDGSWWRKTGSALKMQLLRGGAAVVAGWLDVQRTSSNAVCQAFRPLVSCLMVTGKRPHLAALAIEAFRRQTYANRELVIIDDSGGEALREACGGEDPLIRWVRLPPEQLTLGALRNRALAEARGEVLCQWDDDDLSAPQRLERQVQALAATGADACGLLRLHLWWPAQERLAVSSSRVWEGALMWRKGCIAAYPELRAGEDTPPVKALVARGTVVMIDAPSLYVYIHHGENTFSAEHWQSLWVAASQRSSGQACRLKLQLMQGVLPCDAYLVSLGLPAWEAGARVEEAVKARPVEVGETLQEAGAPVLVVLELPRILVATPIKNAVPFLEGFFAGLRGLDYPAAKLNLAFLEGDSDDATVGRMEGLMEEHGAAFGGVRLMRRDFGYRPGGARWEVSQQRRRREILAKSRNLLVEGALGQEEWVLWVDVDVVSWPADIIHRLLAMGREIVTPHCVREAGGMSFDLNTFVFRDAEKRDGSDCLRDGLYQPERGATRLYLESFRDRAEVEVDGVGGTMLWVKADLHRDGLRFPARPYRGFIETEGLAFAARDFGVKCWGLPQLEILHH
jgi:hypothetical protein